MPVWVCIETCHGILPRLTFQLRVKIKVDIKIAPFLQENYRIWGGLILIQSSSLWNYSPGLEDRTSVNILFIKCCVVIIARTILTVFYSWVVILVGRISSFVVMLFLYVTFGICWNEQCFYWFVQSTLLWTNIDTASISRHCKLATPNKLLLKLSLNGKELRNVHT